MDPDLTADSIDEWLKSNDRDRAWLANELSTSIGTVYNWWSKGFPLSAKKKIAKLMQASHSRGQGIELSFTDAEFDDILLAMKLTGYTRRREFYHDAIVEKAAAVKAAEKRIIQSGIERVDNLENRVAEDPPKLG